MVENIINEHFEGRVLRRWDTWGVKFFHHWIFCIEIYLANFFIVIGQKNRSPAPFQSFEYNYSTSPYYKKSFENQVIRFLFFIKWVEIIRFEIFAL